MHCSWSASGVSGPLGGEVFAHDHVVRLLTCRSRDSSRSLQSEPRALSKDSYSTLPYTGARAAPLKRAIVENDPMA